mgnify:CR=1 FL=1
MFSLKYIGESKVNVVEVVPSTARGNVRHLWRSVTDHRLMAVAAS